MKRYLLTALLLLVGCFRYEIIETPEPDNLKLTWSVDKLVIDYHNNVLDTSVTYDPYFYAGDPNMIAYKIELVMLCLTDSIQAIQLVVAASDTTGTNIAIPSNPIQFFKGVK